MSGKLYVVGTPIGNLEDMSPRAVRILKETDFIAAEDTRVTLKLLNHFDIKKELVSYYEHNKNEKGAYLLNRILCGESMALVTDAGMPAISDPGEDLVREARIKGVPIESVPGPVAFATALSISGMESGRFCFEGFLSVNKPSRRKHLEEIKDEKRTLIFYEAPHKLLATLKDFEQTLGDRKIAVCKELTKIHESVFLFTLSEAFEYFSQNPPKGEYVLIIEGKKEEKREFSLSEAAELAKKFLNEGQSASTAAKEAARITGVKKSEIYKEICT